MSKSVSGELLGAVELGGTKVLAAIATDPLVPIRTIRIPTGDPAITLAQVNDFFRAAEADFGQMSALGVGAFGPVHLDPGAPEFGLIGRTPKPGWSGVDLLGDLAASLRCPITLDTDVNAAALGETWWGAGRATSSLAYLTVGTGIGGGIVYNGRTVKGAQHPEIGHIRIARHPGDDYSSRCPFHADCVEGLASGPTIMDRFGVTLEELAADHPFRAILADYLAQLCAALVLVASPERIVIGGGVMSRAEMHGDIERNMRIWLNGYIEPGGLAGSPFIVPPVLGDHAGLAGAFAMAIDSLKCG